MARSELQREASRKNGCKGGRPRQHWCGVCRSFHKLPLCASRKAKPKERT